MIEYRFYGHMEFYESAPDNGYKLTRVPERDKYIMYGCNINDETAKDVFKKMFTYYSKHGCTADDGKHVCELELHVCNNGKTLKSINFWNLVKDIGPETKCKFVLDEEKLERFLNNE